MFVNASRWICAGSLLLGLALLMSPALSAGHAVPEQTVSFDYGGKKILGALVTPEGTGPFPIVLILHGMSGYRNGPPVHGTPSGLLEYSAQVFARHRIASLRISTGGRGGSEGDYRDMTLERRIGEAMQAVNWISGQAQLDKNRISILGHSQGATVAMSAARRLEQETRIASLALWAPQPFVLSAYRGVMGETVYQKGLHAAPGEVVGWRDASGRQRAFRSGFFKGLANIDSLSDVANYAGPILVVTGKKDHWARLSKVRILGQHHKGNTAFLDFDVGHRMGASSGPDAVDLIAEETVRWILKSAGGN